MPTAVANVKGNINIVIIFSVEEVLEKNTLLITHGSTIHEQ